MVTLPTDQERADAIAEARAALLALGWQPGMELTGAQWGTVYTLLEPVARRYTEFWTQEQNRLIAESPIPGLYAELDRLSALQESFAAIPAPVGVPLRDGTLCASANGYTAYWYDGVCYCPDISAQIQSLSQAPSGYLQEINNNLQWIIVFRDEMYQEILVAAPPPPVPTPPLPEEAKFSNLAASYTKA